MKIIRVGVDIAKSVFHCHGVDRFEKTQWQGKYRRERWLGALSKRVPKGSEIGMEACASSHYWGREFTAVRLRNLDRSEVLESRSLRYNSHYLDSYFTNWSQA